MTLLLKVLIAVSVIATSLTAFVSNFVGASETMEFLTAALFVVGKVLSGLYLGYSSVSSAFGAAESPAVFLIWVYYSAAIFLFGAELSQQIA